MLIQRKLREDLKESHPQLDVSFPKPLYHPSRDTQAVGRIDIQDALVVSAPTKHGPNRIQLEHRTAQRYGINREQPVARVDALLASGARAVDASNWLG